MLDGFRLINSLKLKYSVITSAENFENKFSLK